MYKVYGSVVSRAFRVLWALEEMGVAYEHHDAKPQSEAARALNPSGKVPILLDGDAVLTDSTAILTYLADKHGQLTYPAGTVDRAHQDALTHTILDEFDAVLWTAARHSFILPEDRRVPQVSDSLKWEFARNLDRLADRFVGPFLQGDQMTIADIICVHCLNWAFGAKFPVENERLIAYSKQMRARDAFKRVRALG
ncbi:MAG: glutathione S-transferase family protein [Antarcticimicrobium sp.]|uniref:glutathione S-transferase family protein n=1 Tax=Antarcticimicrobium sp. TaxID=2824147 RepID=UPI002602F55C|nr:glutathione S-transferase family protein [Antarcticimicrobium sp.]MDF1717026.1 glutathione S-transferase family protein [Antarcticimicrobium sp.]